MYAEKEKARMIPLLIMVFYLVLQKEVQCLYVPVGSPYNIARLEAISKIQQDLVVVSSGKLERNYVGMTELFIGSTKYLVTTSSTTNRTFQLFLFNDVESLISNRFIDPPLELKVNDSSAAGNVLKPFQGASFIRLFNVGQQLYVMYTTTVQQFVALTMSEGNIYFHQHDVVLVDASNILVPNECRYNMNNWVTIPSHRVRKGYLNFMFICSIYPHRVLPLMYKKNSTTQVQVVFDDEDLDYQSVISRDANAEFFLQQFWPYGYPECGTTPLLTNTSQGQRFISFFWSEGITVTTNKMGFFGAYVFENYPLLRITHFSADPVLIPPFLTKNLVPLGSKEINGSIFVMLRDGTDSYWILLKKNAFLKSLREVSSANLSATSDKQLRIIKTYSAKIKPSYYEMQFKLMEFQKRQYEKFFLDEWPLLGATRNPAVAYFNGSFIVVSCLCTNKIRWGSFQCLYQQYTHFLSPSYQTHFNPTLIVLNEHNVGLVAEDMRLIVVNDTRLYGVFTNHRPRKHHQRYHYDQFVTELVFKDSQLFAIEPMVMNVSYNLSLKCQKNWMPFLCNVSMTRLCFVQSIVPHTIVTSKNGFFSTSIGDNNMIVIAQTSYALSTIWLYGEPRGGSQAELVDTPYGRRYFALFHSSQDRGRGIKTYYAGGYLFRAIYPYDITHISVEPLAPASFYNMSQAWPHRGMDFVVFPMSLFVRGDIAYAIFGIQDRAGAMISFKLQPFFLTMKTVAKAERRTIISLTTSPKRIAKIGPTITSLLQQTVKADVIQLNLPRIFARTNDTFPNISILNPQIRIVWHDDIGPVSKLVPTLQTETHPDTLIITVDDDTIYPPHMVALMKERIEYDPNFVQTGHCGDGALTNKEEEFERLPFNLNLPSVQYKKQCCCRLHLGFGGVGYRRGLFDNPQLPFDRYLRVILIVFEGTILWCRIILL